MSHWYVDEVRELAAIMAESGLTALEITQEEGTIKLERAGTSTAAPSVPAVAVQTEVQVAHPTAEAAGKEISSPMVGVFYAAAAPGETPFVQVGDRVQKGDVLCIIEAMKLMNEISAEEDGVITEICVNNGDVVEFGQPLFRIR